eukprot:TRINITY_DN179_c0_g1_i1.p1 TRINITY_DN179_c0_g1~~TRINITY_DN179_c0_g1_i1.p1  ORF type:complete len:410 (+),score=74.70 TRINITY_DN179_c0_g1_i1:212-1441(+)
MESKFAKYTQYKESDYLFKKYKGFSTKAIHAGQEPEKVHGSVITPIHMTSTFILDTPTKLHGDYLYTRWGNPTSTALDQALAACEFGKYCIAFSSGSAAMVGVLHTLKVGDHLIAFDDLYGGTNSYLRNFTQKQHGVNVEFIDLTNLENLKKSLKESTKLIWIETPSNPTMKLVDIEEACKIAHTFNKSIKVVVDNTFASPYLQSPLLLGADIVVHSLTKYVSGHSDLVMGAAITNEEELYKNLQMCAKSVGGNPSPFDSFLALRGLKSLECRMKQHCYNAYCIAHFLRSNKHVEKVLYPGFEDHPQNALCKKQMRGYGGMISIVIKGGAQQTEKFCTSLKLFKLAVSLGGVESLINVPKTMTHANLLPEQQKLLGITDTFIRLSIGIEEVEDLLEDLDNALKLTYESK